MTDSNTNSNETNSNTNTGTPSKASSSSFGSTELDRYLIMLKSSKGAAAAALIEQILRTSGIFSFGEFLSHANIVALQGSKHENWFNALELFAYGTLSDYQTNSAKYPTLDERQILKLKQLSIVTMAAQSTTKILFYKHLMRILDVKTVRELEDMVISCVYQGLIVAKLDQRRGRVEIASCRGRDIGPKAIGLMKNRLLSWLQYTDNLIANLEQKQQMATELHLSKEIMYKQAQMTIENKTAEIIEKIQTEKAIALAQHT